MDNRILATEIKEDLVYSKCYLYGLVATISLGSIQFGTLVTEREGYGLGQLHFWTYASAVAREMVEDTMLVLAIAGAFCAGPLVREPGLHSCSRTSAGASPSSLPTSSSCPGRPA
jgi:hypothetical protein